MSLSREIAEAYTALAREGVDAERAADAVTAFLAENNLWALKDRIIEHATSIEDAERSYDTVAVTFAHGEHKRIAGDIARTIVGTEHPHIAAQEDVTLIGGFKARYRGREWDASIEGALGRLRANLKQ